MVAALIIVFREVIEAGLVIGIVLAATRGVPRRGHWIAAGILGGLAGASLVAGFADFIANSFTGAGQELLNAGILLVAVLMLGWHNVWMSRHGRAMAQEMHAAGLEVVEGKRSMTMLAVVVGVAVLREGAEVVLFLYGVAAQGSVTAGGIIGGGLVGVALGGIVAALMYLGLLKVPTRHLFAVTSGLIALLAAGMAAQAVAFLEQAGLIQQFTEPLWNTSALVSERSLPGRVLHTLIGYTDQPTGVQLMAYLVTLATIIVLMRLVRHHPVRPGIARTRSA
jgi:high-affinity iron transporter